MRLGLAPVTIKGRLNQTLTDDEVREPGSQDVGGLDAEDELWRSVRHRSLRVFFLLPAQPLCVVAR
jgi:hypothetical protein